MKVEKPAIEKFVSIWKRLFVIFSIFALPALMLCLVFACLGYAAFWIISPALFLVYITLYGVYAMRVSMGTVIGIEVTAEVVHIRTKRRIYTYDARGGCVAVKVKKNKFVCTFETQDSRDKYTFYRRALFSKSYEEQFTPEEIAAFYPAIEQMEV